MALTEMVFSELDPDSPAYLIGVLRRNKWADSTVRPNRRDEFCRVITEESDAD